MILPYTEQHSFTVDGVLLIIIIAPRHHRPSTSQSLSLRRYVRNPDHHDMVVLTLKGAGAFHSASQSKGG